MLQGSRPQRQARADTVQGTVQLGHHSPAPQVHHLVHTYQVQEEQCHQVTHRHRRLIYQAHLPCLEGGHHRVLATLRPVPRTALQVQDIHQLRRTTVQHLPPIHQQVHLTVLQVHPIPLLLLHTAQLLQVTALQVQVTPPHRLVTVQLHQVTVLPAPVTPLPAPHILQHPQVTAQLLHPTRQHLRATALLAQATVQQALAIALPVQAIAPQAQVTAQLPRVIPHHHQTTAPLLHHTVHQVQATLQVAPTTAQVAPATHQAAPNTVPSLHHTVPLVQVTPHPAPSTVQLLQAIHQQVRATPQARHSILPQVLHTVQPPLLIAQAPLVIGALESTAQPHRSTVLLHLHTLRQVLSTLLLAHLTALRVPNIHQPPLHTVPLVPSTARHPRLTPLQPLNIPQQAPHTVQLMMTVIWIEMILTWVRLVYGVYYVHMIRNVFVNSSVISESIFVQKHFVLKVKLF